MIDYNAILEELRTGKRESFELNSEDFTAFYEVWRDYPYQNAIVGQAVRGGKVTYRPKQ
ncbi:hypothetical protein OIT44_06215 [Weissella ceti]|uniref:Uncharacterized protein n=1 Tax=Weissella ceti TaxID=759620 RepID=A0ABT3E5H1_9LACO|nr:hypothetical protein [Weissella ceti]MCW0953652.1 hypothetical protein [Weissella ceti]QVK12832.1 hypothetical protein KHQ31_01020 [Weissella ceti]